MLYSAIEKKRPFHSGYNLKPENMKNRVKIFSNILCNQRGVNKVNIQNILAFTHSRSPLPSFSPPFPQLQSEPWSSD
jgi:hypothetical protein